MWVAAAFLMIGLYFGVKHGPRHLSDSEMAIRLRNIQNMGRWLQPALSSAGRDHRAD
jgi:hypothetical protein